LAFLASAGVFSCSSCEGSPQVVFDHANHAYQHGDLKQSRKEASQAYERFRVSNPDWAWRFRVLEAKAALSTDPPEEVLKLLKSEPVPSQPDLAIPVLTQIGVANIYQRNFSEGRRSLDEAQNLCDKYPAASCGDVLQARALLASQQTDSASAEQLYQRSLLFARSHGDKFLEATSLLNLGDESLAAAHFDEAIDRSLAASQAAKTAGAKVVEQIALGNIGWAYYRLGDADRALELFLEAEKQSEVNDPLDQGAWLTDAGYVYMTARKFELARESFGRALEIEQGLNSKEEIYNVERALARLAVETGDDNATYYAEQALAIARASGNHLNELYPTLVEGQVAAHRGDVTKARQVFQGIESDPVCPVFLRWEAEHSLAQLDEDAKQSDAADHEYRAALATFEAARSTVRHEDFQLSFLTNAASIYDDYVHFLVARGKAAEALRWADFSRARTLSEGLGLVSKGLANGGHDIAPPLNPKEIAGRARGVLLFYWLGGKQSYLWAITQRKTSLFPLPPGAEIDALVRRYRQALGGPQDVLESSEEGRVLYRTLIAPAKTLLANGEKVFIIPDGSLNNLNFETLVVPDPKPHFWIEDADVIDASSLRVLAASFVDRNNQEKKGLRRLLLIGDSVAPSKEYPELPRAGEQMEDVAKHFPVRQEQVYERDQATPAAYLDSDPGKFSYIHFVAHGTASRLSPLDSAIVLSRDAGETDSFKLYARDIVKHRLHADLVTVSACYGAGARAYSGEGLVGLAWAFLRAGAHNVIASLWEVTDASTEQLMDGFYDELDKGASPDMALRAAKLSLLHGGEFHNPFYWAPFQFYTGS
jgi:CHAT domain-containing protein/Tfp pilus assembly protein PilF